MQTKGANVGQWFSAPCEVIGMPFICEVPPTVADASCTRNYNGYCYTPSHEMNLASPNNTYLRAQGICQTTGGNLMSIHSKPEINYIKAIYRDAGIPQIFLGAQSFLPDTFDWEDGSNWDFDYTNPLSTTKGNCLGMDLSKKVDSGLWSEINCQSINYFICKRKIVPTVPTTMGSATVLPMTEEKKAINPKFQRKVLSRREELLDFSNCNSTLYMSPGVITSFGYPSTKPPATYCTWTVAALGPYKVGLYFTDFSTYNYVTIYDEYGNVVASPNLNRNPFSVIGTSNILTLTHDSRYDAAYNYHGFSATVLPI